MFRLYKVRIAETARTTARVCRNILRVGKVCVIALFAIVVFAACSSSIESDAKKMAKLYYGLEMGKVTKADFEKFSDKCEVKYKTQETEFTLLFYEEMIKLSINEKNWEFAIATLDDYVGEWKYSIEDMPLSKTNELVEKTRSFISTLKGKKEYLKPDDIDDLREIEETLTSIVEDIKQSSDVETESASSYDDDDSDISNSSEDWDAILNSYEQFINKYISLLKKAQNGDMSAMTEYTEYMEKATDLAEKLENADDELTPAQAAKFVKLQTKLANAAVNL